MLIHNLVATGSLSYNGVNISYVTGSQTSLDGLNQFSASVNTTTGSLNETTGSLNTATGSLFTASGSFSTRVTRIEGNYATTGSNVFLGAQTVCANITSTGTIIAQTLNVQQVTSSIVYSSGSNIFGCSTSDVQQITGSLRMTGSIATFSTNCFGIGTSTPLAYNNYVALTVGDNSTTKTGLIKLRSCYNAGDGAEVYQTTAGTLTVATNGSDSAFRIFSNNIASFTCQTCAPGMDIMPSGIGVSTLGGIMRVVTTGTSTGIAVGQSNSNRYTHFAANDIQVFNDDFFLTTRCAFPLSIGTCYTARLTFAATGEACFSCQVCAPNLLIPNCATIGTVGFSYPEFRLAVTPTMTVVGNGTGPVGEGIYFKRTSNLCQGGWISGNGGALIIVGQNKHASAFGDIYFSSNNGSTTCDIMVIDGNNRRVGIGTTTPCATLTVEGANSAFPLTYNSGFGNIHIQTNETTATQNFGGTLTFGGLGRTSGPTEKFIWAAIAGRKQTTTSGDPKGYLQFGTLNDDTNQIAERMRITACGNVGIGITADNPIANGGTFRNLLVGNGAGYGVFQGISTATATDSTVAAFGGGTTGASGFKNAGSINIELDGTSTTNATGRIAFYTGTGGTIGERMRITSGGWTKASTNGSYRTGATGTGHEFADNDTGAINHFTIHNSSASTAGQLLRIVGDRTTTNGTFQLIQASNGNDSGRFLVLDSGNVQNTNGSYGTISSDRRLKENIIDATSKLEDIMKLRVVNFNLIGNEQKNIGFIAQEMKEIFPSLVYQTDTRKYDDEGNVISGYEDTLGLKVGMEFALLVKAIQEQQCKINILESCLGIN